MRVDTIIVGAGHAGLAVSRLLTDAGNDHVVLDRGRVAERWRTERWDSLHLLTPNWMTRLPGWCYTGPDPDGYLSSAELIQHLERYAASFQAPVIPQTTVLEIAAGRGPASARFRSSPIPTPGTPAMSSWPPVLMAGPTCRRACLACPDAPRWSPRVHIATRRLSLRAACS
jgi:2-polyprenyl-6-methoxyphenol hydroxylase-like FAD-dependent oxidoreductase